MKMHEAERFLNQSRAKLQEAAIAYAKALIEVGEAPDEGAELEFWAQSFSRRTDYLNELKYKEMVEEQTQGK